MKEPWNIKVDDSRSADSQRTFIIFCEDGVVEPEYFELFKRKDIHISTHRNKSALHAQVDHATDYLREKDLIEVIEVNGIGKEVLKIDEGAQVWCVFDRDKNPDDKKDTSFNDSIDAANSKGIKTAWSNDAFELWILLHCEDVDPSDSNYSHRKKYYERLTEILREQFPDEPKFQNPKFDYYEAMKKKDRFFQFTYQLMKENIDVAIERAEKLEIFHATPPSKPAHKHCPCTRVHHLIKELKLRS